MTAAVAASNVKRHETATITLSSATASTPHTVTIKSPSGEVETQNVTTNGLGGATVSFVPQEAGTHTITVTTVTTVATATVTGSGS